MVIKKFLITLFISVCCLSAHAQEWLTNFDKAKEIASSTNKNIVLVFQGSDWCGPCMKLDKEIWSTEAFKTYATEHFVMLQADFPRKRQNKLSKEQEKHNGMLFEKYNRTESFPYVVVLNSEGKVLGASGYKNISVEEYIKELAAF